MTAELPYSPMMRDPDPAPCALEAMRLPMRLDAACKECEGALGKTFHVVNGVVKCDRCFKADVAKLNTVRSV
jgi:hypothetical protein